MKRVWEGGSRGRRDDIGRVVAERCDDIRLRGLQKLNRDAERARISAEQDRHCFRLERLADLSSDKIGSAVRCTLFGMVRFLLLPEDEAEFFGWACEEHSLELAMAIAEAGGPTRIQPVTELPVPLPGPPVPRSASPLPTEYLLRRREWPVNDLEPWDGNPAVKQVMQQLNAEAAEAAGVSLGDLVDFERTRVIRFRRCGWIRDGELHVAALQGSARPARLQDPAVAGMLKSLERWLVRGSVRIDSADVVRYRPRILARPAAHSWVLSGGVVHPWDA